MREMTQKKVDDMKNAVEKYQSDKPGKNGKKITNEINNMIDLRLYA